MLGFVGGVSVHGTKELPAVSGFIYFYDYYYSFSFFYTAPNHLSDALIWSLSRLHSYRVTDEGTGQAERTDEALFVMSRALLHYI